MKLLLFFAILGFSLASVHRVPLKKIPSVRERMIRNGEWMEYRARKEQGRLTSKAKDGYSQPIADFDDQAYTMNVAIGTPPQSFEVLLSLNTGDVWVPEVSCGADNQECQAFGCDLSLFCNVLCPQPSCCDRTHPPSGNTMCRGKEKFNTTLSSTYNETNILLEVDFEDGYLFGPVALETISFAGGSGDDKLRVTGSAACFASNVPNFLEFVPADGVFGLGPFASAASKFLSPLDNAINQELIAPVFSIYLAFYPEEVDIRGGLITYGSIDTDNCADVLLYTPFTSVSSYEYTVQGISAGDASFKGSYRTVSESAAVALTLPTNMAEKLISSLGAARDPVTGLVLINCNAVNTTPDITIQIAQRKFQINVKNMIFPYTGNQCILAIDEADSFGFGPDIILGEPFMRAYCHIFDIGSQKIGFAPSK